MCEEELKLVPQSRAAGASGERPKKDAKGRRKSSAVAANGGIKSKAKAKTVARTDAKTKECLNDLLLHFDVKGTATDGNKRKRSTCEKALTPETRIEAPAPPKERKLDSEGRKSRRGSANCNGRARDSSLSALFDGRPAGSKPKAQRPSGIRNIGNTCYLGSSVQCLKHTKLLWEYIKSGQCVGEISSESKGEIVRSFCGLIEALDEDQSSVTPQEFKKVISNYSTQFSGTEQSDAHEFLTFLIDKLHEELKSGLRTEPVTEEERAAETAPLGFRSKIKELFYGLFKSTIECTHCAHVSRLLEPFMCLSLPIEGNIDVITLTLHTLSQHLFIISCKYDDDSITIESVKQEIQKEVIVGCLDMYLLLSDQQILPLLDSQTFADITKYKSEWHLCAIERRPEPTDFLVKTTIAKHSPSFLMTCPADQREDPFLLKELVRRLVGGAAGDFDPQRSIAHDLDFVVLRVEDAQDRALPHTRLELQASGKSSDLKQLWSKLPQKHIELIRHKTVERYGSLKDCLERFTNAERLSQWVCPECKWSKDANKSVAYVRLPKILIIHLKRFKMVGKKSRIKISTLVTFPQILLIKTINNETHMYNLYAVLNHIGDIERGHYTAYCRNLRSRNEWLEFDDNKVRPIDAIQLETNKAYVLFYERS